MLAELLAPPLPPDAPTLAHALREPVLRQILSWLESPEGRPSREDWERITGNDAIAHLGSHADLLLFNAGKRAERERVFIALVQALALLSFVPGGHPPLLIAEDWNACELAEYLKGGGQGAELPPSENRKKP